MLENTSKQHIFISFSDDHVGLPLAQVFNARLAAAGHHCFMSQQSLKVGDDWSVKIAAELEQCDFFLLILSPKAAASDMVAEEVRRAKRLYDKRPEKRPTILRLDACIPADLEIRYDLGGYTNKFHFAEWNSERDTERVFELFAAAIGFKPDLPHIDIEPVVKPFRRNRGLPPELYHSLRHTLINECSEFADSAHLRNLFSVEGLAIWRPYLPPPDTLDATVDKVVGELARRHTKSGENALATLLAVLAERRDVDDQLRDRLMTLSYECRQVLSADKA